MKITTEDAEQFLTLPEDTIVQVMVDTISSREVEGRDGRDGWTSLNFKFKLLELPTALEDEYVSLIGGPLFGSVGAKLTTHPDNKLRQWAEALLDIEIEGGFDLDTEMLEGRKARAVIGNYTKKGSTTQQHKVVGLLPLVPASVGGSGSFSSFDDEPPF